MYLEFLLNDQKGMLTDCCWVQSRTKGVQKVLSERDDLSIASDRSPWQIRAAAAERERESGLCSKVMSM